MDDRVDQFDHAGLVQLVLELRDENRRLRERIEELEGKNPTPRLDESYSLDAEERRRRTGDATPSADTRGKGLTKDSQKSSRRGRRSTQDKVDQADRIELVVPDGLDSGSARSKTNVRSGDSSTARLPLWFMNCIADLAANRLRFPASSDDPSSVLKFLWPSLNGFGLDDTDFVRQKRMSFQDQSYRRSVFLLMRKRLSLSESIAPMIEPHLPSLL